MFGVSAMVQSLLSSPLSLLLFEILSLIAMGFFIWVGANVAQVRKASLGRSVVAAVLMVLIASLLILPLETYAFFGLLASIVINIAVIKLVFSARWRKALVTWVFSIISQVLVFIIAGIFLLLLA